MYWRSQSDFTKHFNTTRVRSVVTRSCCVSSMLRHGQKSQTSFSVHLTFGPYDNALICWFLVVRICVLISKDTSSGRIRERFVPSKSPWLKVLSKQAMAKDCRWNKLANHGCWSLLTFLYFNPRSLTTLEDAKIMPIKIHFKGYRTDKRLVK